MKALANHILIHPIWPEEKLKHGSLELDGFISALVYAERFYAYSGIVIDASPVISEYHNCTHDIRPGDTVYFHYNATDYDNAISGREAENIYSIDFQMVYAWKRGDEIFMAKEWCFIEPVIDEKENYFTDSGLMIVKNANVVMKNGEFDVVTQKKYLEGVVRHLPRNSTETFINEGEIKIGDRVKIESTSDVNFSLDGKDYYRTRYSEILCVYERVQD